MIVYENTLGNFKQDVILNQIVDEINGNLRKLRLSGGSQSEINSWNNSLHFMKDVLDCNELSNDKIKRQLWRNLLLSWLLYFY